MEILTQSYESLPATSVFEDHDFNTEVNSTTQDMQLDCLLISCWETQFYRTKSYQRTLAILKLQSLNSVLFKVLSNPIPLIGNTPKYFDGKKNPQIHNALTYIVH